MGVLWSFSPWWNTVKSTPPPQKNKYRKENKSCNLQSIVSCWVRSGDTSPGSLFKEPPSVSESVVKSDPCAQDFNKLMFKKFKEMGEGDQKA